MRSLGTPSTCLLIDGDSGRAACLHPICMQTIIVHHSASSLFPSVDLTAVSLTTTQLPPRCPPPPFHPRSPLVPLCSYLQTPDHHQQHQHWPIAYKTYRRSPSLLPKYTHFCPSLAPNLESTASVLMTCSMARPTRPVPPVTRTTVRQLTIMRSAARTPCSGIPGIGEKDR